MNIACPFCKKDSGLSKDFKIGRSTSCDKCSADLHCCKVCSFYDAKHYNECREPSAERVADKEKRNFCDYFSFSNNASTVASKQEDATNNLNELFK